ncbi:MAG: hypothetical protein IRZ16_23075 [Myxococcaceae bacterium]|nr:hypothetical protein [Myxococcaceae bacterium]
MIRTSLVRRSAAVLLSALTVQAISLSVLSSVALAQDAAPRIVVLPVSVGPAVPAKAPSRFRDLLEEELKSRETISVVPPKTNPEPPKPPAELSATPPAEALRALEEGQAALADLRFDDAARALQQGIAKMSEHPEGIDFEKLIDAYVSLAVASFRQGDEEAAQKALFAVVRLSPGYQVPDGKYPPIFVREVQKAKRRAEKAIRGAVSIDGPAGATAFVDGRNVGALPVVQDNLVAGPHFVKVEGTSGELFGAVVDVRRGTTRVTATPQPVGGRAPAKVAGIIGPVLDRAAVTEVAETIDALGADYAVVGCLYRSGEHQLTAATAVFSARVHGFAVVRPYTFDEELLTANVEAYKLADDITDLVGEFPRAVALPVDLGAGASAYTPTNAVAVRTQEVDLDIGERRTALLPRRDRPAATKDETPHLVPDDDEVHAINGGAVSADYARQIQDDEVPGGEVRKGGVPWWVWAVAGVAVVGAAGGTYYGISQATRPVTGTVTARW